MSEGSSPPDLECSVLSRACSRRNFRLGKLHDPSKPHVQTLHHQSARQHPNQPPLTPRIIPSQLFDSRRDRMESEKRELVNFHSTPDWRVAVFETNRRRQLDGSQSLNKARGAFWEH